jgi:hypothetical protein
VIAAIGGTGVDEGGELPTDVLAIGANSKTETKVEVSGFQYSFVSILSKRVKQTFRMVVEENEGETKNDSFPSEQNKTSSSQKKPKDETPDSATTKEKNEEAEKTETETEQKTETETETEQKTETETEQKTETETETEQKTETETEQKTGVYFSIDLQTQLSSMSHYAICFDRSH